MDSSAEVSGINVNSSQLSSSQLSGSNSGNGSSLVDSSVFGSTLSTISTIMNTIQVTTSKGVDLLDAYVKNVTARYEAEQSEKKKKAKNSPEEKGETLIKALTDNVKFTKLLTKEIKEGKIKVDVRGANKNYFKQLIDFLSNDKNVGSINRVQNAFQKFVTTVARLSRYSTHIDKLGLSLLNTFSSIGKLSKSMLIFSGSLALLGVTVATFVSAVGGEALVSFIGIMIALRLAGKVSMESAWDMGKLAVSVALLGLAVYGFTEVVDFDRMANFVGSIAIVGGVVYGFSRLSKVVNKNAKSIFVASGAIVAMAVSFGIFAHMLSTVQPIDLGNITVTGIAMAGVATIYNFLGSPAFAKNIAIGSAVALAIGLSLPILSWGLSKLSQIDITLKRAGEVGLIVAGVATIFGIIGIPIVAGAVALGSVVAIAMSAGISTLVYALNQMSGLSVQMKQFEMLKAGSKAGVESILHFANPLTMGLILVSAPIAMALASSIVYLGRAINTVSKMPNINIDMFTNFKEATKLMIGAYDSLGFGNATMIILGALPVAGALWSSTYYIAKAVEHVGKIKHIDKRHYDNYKSSVKNLIDVYGGLGVGKMTKVILGALPVAGALWSSTYFMSKAVSHVGKIPILKNQHYTNYKFAVDKLMSIYGDIGGWTLAKVTAKASMVSVVATASVLSAGAIRAFTKISRDPKQVQIAVDSIGMFIDGMLEKFNSASVNYEKTKDGIRAFAGIGNLVKGIAEGVKMLGKLEFEEKEVVNGKLVTKRVTKLTPDDIKNVGKSIGMVLNSLTEPLSAIGGSNDSTTVFGYKITNPFSNKVKKGIEAMSKIGNILAPIINTTKFIIANGLSDQNKIKMIGQSIAILLSSISTSFKKSTDDLKNAEFTNMLKASKVVDNFTISLTRKGFIGGVNAFSVMSKNVASVKDSLNAMDALKLTKFSNMVSGLAELNRNQGLKALVDAFHGLINELNDFKKVRQEEIRVAGENKKEVDALRAKIDELQNNPQTTTKPLPSIFQPQGGAVVASPIVKQSSMNDEILDSINRQLRTLTMKISDIIELENGKHKVRILQQ